MYTGLCLDTKHLVSRVKSEYVQCERLSNTVETFTLISYHYLLSSRVRTLYCISICLNFLISYIKYIIIFKCITFESNIKLNYLKFKFKNDSEVT